MKNNLDKVRELLRMGYYITLAAIGLLVWEIYKLYFSDTKEGSLFSVISISILVIALIIGALIVNKQIRKKEDDKLNK